MPTSATNEMLDAFRYNRFAEVAFAEKCRFFSMDGTVDELLVLAARVSRLLAVCQTFLGGSSCCNFSHVR